MALFGNPQDVLTTPYGLGGQFSPETAAAIQALNRKRLISNLLIQQGLQPAQGQMAGRFYVPPSPVQGVANMAQVLAGALGSGAIDRQQEALTKKDADRAQADIQAYMDFMQSHGRATPAAVPPQAGPAPVTGPYQGEVGATPLPEPGVTVAPKVPPFRGIAPGPPTAPPPAPLAPEAAVGESLIPQQRIAQYPPGQQPEGLSATILPADLSQASPHPLEGQPALPVPTPPAAPAPIGPIPTPPMMERAPVSPDRNYQAIVQLMANQHPAVQRFAALEYQRLQRGDELTAQEEQKRLDRELRREGLETNALMRLEQMRNTHQLMQLQIDNQLARGQDAAELKRQQLDLSHKIAEQTAETNRARDRQASADRRAHDETLRAIAGMGAATKQQAAQEKRTALMEQEQGRLDSATAGFDRLAATAQQLLTHPGLAGITGIRGQLPDIPGSDAANARALLNKLKSQVALDVLQDMRNNSKTGGALGNVSDAEGKRLETNLASLESAQSLEQFRSELQSIVNFTQGAQGRLQNAFDRKYGGAPSAPPASGARGPATGQTLQTLPPGARVIGKEKGTGKPVYETPDGKRFIGE